LQVDVVIFHVRSAEVLVEAEQVAHGAGRKVNRSVGIECPAEQAGGGDWIGAEAGVGGTGVENAGPWQGGHKEILRDSVIGNAPTAAHDGFAVASDIPSGGHARRPVVVVGIVEAAAADQ